MTSKRGTQNAVLAAVLVVGIVGLYFAFSVSLGPQTNLQTAGMQTLDSQVVMASPQIVYTINEVSGNFAAPAAKAYGGEIRGVMDSQSRAFSGRATQVEQRNCYTCSCNNIALTSADRQTAAKVCRDNCGGTIIAERPGVCE